MDGARDSNLRRKTANLQRPTGGRASIDGKARVVAAVHSPATLGAAAALWNRPEAAPDLLELRVDHFAHDPAALAALDALAARPPRPLLVTVRRGDEGGAVADLDDAARARLYARFLPAAMLVDVEVRSLAALAGTVSAARQAGAGLVASFHDFQGMPGLARLRELAGRAVDAGAAVFKVAAMTERPGDLARLLDFLDVEDRVPLALMGMGRLGKASRVVLAAAGSVLCYGYLGGEAQVPGQWPVERLRERIEEEG